MPKDFLGKKWYFFVNYEGMRFPNVNLNFERRFPRLCSAPESSRCRMPAGKYLAYNLNPNPVTVMA